LEKLEKFFLYLVVLGGRTNKANIEIHDVRWVIGSKIEDTYNTLRNDWFGSPKGLHIDSYKKINYVDGYRINLKNYKSDKIQNKKLEKKIKSKKHLWFVNIGGYDPSSMQEKHEFGLIVASSSAEAKNCAKSKWLNDCKKKHKDDINSLQNIIYLDDCKLIKKIDNWEIELIQDNNCFEENNFPDWYGYKRIDKI